MAGMDTQYLDEIHDQLGYFAAWSPAKQFALGDYGDMQNKQFQELGNIKQWVVPKPTSEASGKIYYTSVGDVTANADFGAADAKEKTKVDVRINFKKKYSVFFLAQGTTIVDTANVEQVGDKMVDVYKNKGKDWRLSFVWIKELVKAEQLTVIIARESGVEIALSGTLPIKYKGVDVGELDFRNLSITKNSQSVQHYPAANVTPLFRCYQVKNPITKKAFYDQYR